MVRTFWSFNVNIRDERCIFHISSNCKLVQPVLIFELVAGLEAPELLNKQPTSQHLYLLFPLHLGLHSAAPRMNLKNPGFL